VTGTTGYVLLDASSLEALYLRAALRGEECRDVLAISQHGYTAAVLQKTLAEVWAHAKLGGGNARAWATERADFPGPFDRMVSAIERADPSVDARRTAWLWFNVAQEWYDEPEHLDSVRREFQIWKEAMEAFCQRVQVALEAQGIEVVSPLPQLQTPRERIEAAILEREIGLHSLLPNEDAAWVLDAIVLKARAMVTCDVHLIERGRYSLGFNLAAPSIVHPTRLREALDGDFGLAAYPAAPPLE